MEIHRGVDCVGILDDWVNCRLVAGDYNELYYRKTYEELLKYMSPIPDGKAHVMILTSMPNMYLAEGCGGFPVDIRLSKDTIPGWNLQCFTYDGEVTNEVAQHLLSRLVPRSGTGKLVNSNDGILRYEDIAFKDNNVKYTYNAQLVYINSSYVKRGRSSSKVVSKDVKDRYIEQWVAAATFKKKQK